MADLPPVSLVVLTYNQEGFAGAAAGAALAQDYPRLQVVLSDDCSDDSTVERLQAQASAHSGGHQVIVRRTERNLGLVAHLYDAVRAASGALVVVAAGDDLSYPQRVSRLAERWRLTGADALHSNWDVIDETGALVRRGRPPGQSDLRLDAFFPGRPAHRVIGATAAYARTMFDVVPCPTDRIFAEDLYFSLFLNAFGRGVDYVADPLLGYRAHDAALTHGAGGRSIAEQERATARESAQVAAVLQVFERAARAGGPWGEPRVNWRAVGEDRDFNRFRSSWTSAGPLERLRALRRFAAPSQRRWLLPRLLGLGPLAVGKQLVNRAG